LPDDLAAFAQTSGLVDIPDGSFVEGSHRFNGVQPDYHVDYNHPEIQRLIRYARRARREEPDFWKRIARIKEYVRRRHLSGFDYEDPRYVKLNEQHVRSGVDVSLGEYASCGAGVCRENALYMHIALKEAGIENYHGYAQIQRMSRFLNFDLTEDHGFVVVPRDGELWVVDSYYRGFNGYRLRDLMSKQGITPESVAAPIAEPFVQFRRIIRINPFPVIWSPKKGKSPRSLQIEDYFAPPKTEPSEYYHRKFTDLVERSESAPASAGGSCVANALRSHAVP